MSNLWLGCVIFFSFAALVLTIRRREKEEKHINSLESRIHKLEIEIKKEKH